MTMLAILALTAITVTVHPAHPTVGDSIVIEFPQPVTLVPSPGYEILSENGKRAVVRTFEPKAFALSGRSGEVTFRNLVIPVQSVLKAKDDRQPAALVPPHVDPYPELALWLIGIAAALAALAWTAVVLLARRRAASIVAQAALPPLERYRATVLALRNHARRPKRWAALADATRLYLAATEPGLGAELTTTQVLQRTGSTAVAEILRQGDLEKFSPWGAMPGNFDALADRALDELAPEHVAAEEAA